MSATPRRILFLRAYFAALLFYVPLPFASVTPSGLFVYRVATFALLALTLAVRRSNDRFARVAAPTAGIGAVAVWGLLQTAPWPSSLVSLISPRAEALYRGASEALSAPLPTWIPLSVAPGLTRSAVLGWAAAAAFLATAAAVGGSRTGRRWVFGCVFASVGTQLLFGLRVFLRSPAETGWPPPIGAHAIFHGTFVNANHQAFFMNLGLAAATGAIWWVFGRRAAARLGPARVLAAQTIGAALWVALLLSVVLTGSRGGWLGLMACLAVQILVVFWTKKKRWRAPLALGGLVLAGVILATALPGELGERLLSIKRFESGVSSRFVVWGATLELARDYVWTGSGLGTYGDIYAGIRPAQITDLWLKPHNGPLELLVTGGLISLLSFAAGLFFLVRRLLLTWQESLSSEQRAACLAGLGALTAAMTQEMVDFGLRLPANTLLLLAILGAALGAAVRRSPARKGSAGLSVPSETDS